MHNVNLTYDILFLMIMFFDCLFFGRILRFVTTGEYSILTSLPSTLKAFKKRILKLLNLRESVDQR